MESNFDTATHLVEGAGGIFDVAVDGEIVYSKHQTGEFPDEDALIESLKG